MDGGSGLNILYIGTLDAMHISRSKLRPASSPFHGMIPGAQAYPLGQIDLLVMFGNRANFRSEVLTFEVVDFLGSYHAILGCPCYTKFMAIPNYTYLKLKMPGPNGVITVSSAFSHAFASTTSSPWRLSTPPSSCSSGSRQPQQSQTAANQPPRWPFARSRKPRRWESTPLI